jgi:putative flippase GtrA
VRKLLVYSGVGALNTIIDLLAFTYLTNGLDCRPVLANIVSYSIGIVFSFLMNRKFTFRALPYHYGLNVQFIRFVAINLLSLGMSTTLVSFFCELTSPPFAKMLSVPFVLMWGFFAVRAFVFAAPAPRGKE